MKFDNVLFPDDISIHCFLSRFKFELHTRIGDSEIYNPTIMVWDSKNGRYVVNSDLYKDCADKGGIYTIKKGYEEISFKELCKLLLKEGE